RSGGRAAVEGERAAGGDRKRRGGKDARGVEVERRPEGTGGAEGECAGGDGEGAGGPVEARRDGVDEGTDCQSAAVEIHRGSAGGGGPGVIDLEGAGCGGGSAGDGEDT